MEPRPVRGICRDDQYGGTREALESKDYAVASQYALTYWHHIPDADVKEIERLTNINQQDPERTKMGLAYNRSANRICNRWGLGCQNGTRRNLLECDVCHLSFWCSQECKRSISMHIDARE